MRVERHEYRIHVYLEAEGFLGVGEDGGIFGKECLGSKM